MYAKVGTAKKQSPHPINEANTIPLLPADRTKIIPSTHPTVWAIPKHIVA